MTQSLDDYFAELQRRERKLFNELSASAVVEIAGIVDASGVAGAKSGRAKLWTLKFSFDAWRVEGGGVCKTPLTVRREVTDKELRTLQKRVNPESVIRIRAHVSEQNSFGSPQALLVQFIGKEQHDAELISYLAELKNPVTFDAPMFGTFTLDRRIKWYFAKTTWCGMEVTLNLAAAETSEIEKALSAASKLWKSASSWNAQVQDFAVQELLELKNDHWRDRNDGEITAHDFKQRMKLESITVNADGSFDFWHDDGDLFFGHAIQVSGNLSDGPTQADIPG